MGEGIIAFGGIISLLLFIYAIWLFFFPIVLISRTNKIIELLEKMLPKEEKVKLLPKFCEKCKKEYPASYDNCSTCSIPLTKRTI